MNGSISHEIIDIIISTMPIYLYKKYFVNKFKQLKEKLMKI